MTSQAKCAIHFSTAFGPQPRLTTIDDIVPSAVGAPSAGTRRILARTWIGTTPHFDKFANGFMSRYARDAVGRRILFDHADVSGISRLKLLRLFDAGGNCGQDWQLGTEATLSASAVAYIYDGINWLTGVGRSSQAAPILAQPILPPLPSPPGAPPVPLSGQTVVNAALGSPDLGLDVSYAYNAGGNRTQATEAGNPPSTSDFDVLDREVSKAFDADGNLLDAAHVRRFDSHDRLVIGEGSFAAIYDGCGRRVLVDDGTIQHRCFYDGNTEIAEYNGLDLSTLFSESATDLGVDEWIELVQGGHTYVVHRDYVGSTRMLSDESGSLKARIDFDPYGHETMTNDPVDVRHRFMGREWDSNIEAYHFRSRHYDIGAAQFLQRDPADSAAERSAYQAFGSNPLIFVDPLGRDTSHTGDGLTGHLELRDRIVLPRLEDITVRSPEVLGQVILPRLEDISVRRTVAPTTPMTSNWTYLSPLGAFEQIVDALRTGVGRMEYWYKAARFPATALAKGSPFSQAAEWAVLARRSLEAQTRQNINPLAAYASSLRNQAKYAGRGDSLGPRTLAEARIRSQGGPPKTDVEVMRAAGKTNMIANVGGVALTVLGAIQTAKQAWELAKFFGGKPYHIGLETGINSYDDLPVGYQWTDPRDNRRYEVRAANPDDPFDWFCPDSCRKV